MPSQGNPTSGSTVRCSACDEVLPSDASFCLKCGHRLTNRPSGVGVPDHSLGLNRPDATILGATASAVLPAATNPPVPERIPNAQRTMIGVSLDTSAVVNPALPTASEGAQKTLLGMSSQAATALAAAQQNLSGPQGRSSGRTMLGVPLSSVAPPPAGLSSTVPAGPSAHRHETAPLMGTPAGYSPPAGALSPPEFSQNAPPPAGAHHSTDSGDFNIPGLKPSPRRGWVLLFGAALVSVAAIAGGYLAWKRSEPPPPPLPASVRLLQTGVFEAEVHVDHPTAGMKLRQSGTDYPVGPDGTVRFPLHSVAATQVGEVEAPVEIVRRDRIERRTLRFVIGYRVEVDLSHTADDPPRAHLNFRVPDGATLLVSGQAIRVVGGVGIAAIPVTTAIPNDAPDPVRRERYPVSVRTARGEQIEGIYELRLHRAELHITSPGVLSLAREPMVTVRGRAPGATRVRIGALRTTPRDGTFALDVATPDAVNQLEVTAWAPGFAPASTRITVYRGITAETYLSGGGGDRGVAAIASSPPLAGRLRFDGQVLVATTPGIETPTAQVLVQDRHCPGGRCVVFVELPSGVTLRERSQVEVVGETHGARGYLTPSGERRSAALVRALFVDNRR